MLLHTFGKTFEEMLEQQEADSACSLAELIEKDDLHEFSDLEFDFFDDPLGVVLIPCNGYAIISRSRWVHINGKYTLIAEYALYRCTPQFPEDKSFDMKSNDLRYDATYVLDSVCKEAFENIALAVAHATAQIYMREREV